MTTVKLNDGKTMPILGFGTARLFGEKGKKGIITALQNGIRHLDCAKVYALASLNFLNSYESQNN